MSQVWRFWPWPEGDIDNDVFQFLFPENVRAGYQAIHVLSSPHVLCTENEADNFYPIKFSQWDTHQASRNMLKDVKDGSQLHGVTCQTLKREHPPVCRIHW